MLVGINKKRFVAWWIFLFASSFVVSEDVDIDSPKLQNQKPQIPLELQKNKRVEPQQRLRSPSPPRKTPPPKADKKSILQEQPDILSVVPQKCVPAKGQFVWNFEDEMLLNILKQVSDLLCITIVVNDSINPNLKLTIIGKSLMTAKDAWAVLLASLSAKGLALVEQGKAWTVIKRQDSKNYPSPFYAEGREAANNEGVGTLFYKAKHATSDSLKNIARVLISKDGLVDSVGDQFIIIIDSNSNIRRIGRIFEEMDVEDAVNKIRIIKLNHADAKVVEKQLRELFDVTSGPTRFTRRRGGPADSQGRTSQVNIEKLMADERTNSLLVLADNDSIGPFESAVQLLDQPDTDQTTKGKIHVKKLRYADAKQMAETLSNVVSQGRKVRFGRPRPEGETAAIFEGEVKITAHEDTNTLVTVASSADYASLLATINKLDERKELVYVEAAILDISVSGKNDFGINLFTGFDPKLPGLGAGSIGILANPGGQSIASGIATSLSKDASTDVGGLGKQSVGAIAVLGNFLSGGVAGIVGRPYGDTAIPSFGAVLTALSKNSNVDVLSTPYLLTADNKEAVMSVGEKVPVVRGASTVGGGAAGSALGIPMQNVSYEKVDLTFKITPHVGADDNVRLDVEQEVNELGAETMILNQPQHRIRTKSAKSTIVLKDQQTGVIGGLISHKSSTADQKIPFLGDIPFLGWLFKSRSSENDRKSLLLAITPYIIKSDEDYAKILERKMKEREEFAKLYYGGKIKNYDPHIDYSKKAGPLGSMINTLSAEMEQAQNDGPGAAGETVITPRLNEVEVPSAPAAPRTPESIDKAPEKEKPAEKSDEAWDEGPGLDDSISKLLEEMPNAGTGNSPSAEAVIPPSSGEALNEY